MQSVQVLELCGSVHVHPFDHADCPGQTAGHPAAPAEPAETQHHVPLPRGQLGLWLHIRPPPGYPIISPFSAHMIPPSHFPPIFRIPKFAMKFQCLSRVFCKSFPDSRF